MTRSNWAERFLAAAIVQGAIGFGLASVLLYLAVLGRPAASRIVAGGGAGTWFVVGVIGYGLVGILAVAVSALFYHHIEATLNAPYTGWRNYAAWAHLILGAGLGSAGALLIAYGGYAAGAAMLPTSVGGGGHIPPAGFEYVHTNILGPLVVPIAGLIGLSLLGFFLGGIGYVTAWRNATKAAQKGTQAHRLPHVQSLSGKDPLVRAMVDDYAFGIEQERKEKDHWFREGHDSPIPHERRHGFQGLPYYPVDPALRFRLKATVYPKQETLRFPTSQGTEQEYLRYAYFEFPIEGQPVRLHAYRPVHSHSAQDFLFVPFRDATSGKETYGAGRYLDLPFESAGIYDVDFNRAYSPYCAYSDDYVCPLPPPENWLRVPIRAGEKTWKPEGEA